MSSATFHIGDALTVMKTMPDDSVDLIITSPPFLALRSYLPADHPDKNLEMGSEPDPGAFVDALMLVVEECRRVLAPHGSLCIELGDTYAGSGGAGGDYKPEGLRAGQNEFVGSAQRMRSGAMDDPAAEKAAGVHRIQKEGYRASIRNMDNKHQGGGQGWPLAKSLSLIPETVRFTMAYGRNPHTGRETEPWRIRNVIRWVRPNPPVGALGDKFRPATSEMLVACVSAKRYFDLDAVREPHQIDPSSRRKQLPTGRTKVGGLNGAPGPDGFSNEGNPAGAPPLDWWNIPTHPYKGSHYATFPPELIVRPVKAMCPEKVCVECGEPSRRIVEQTEEYAAFRERKNAGDHGVTGHTANVGNRNQGWDHQDDSAARGIKTQTVGWSDCGHNHYRPGVVLDPFAGTGTVLAVATGHSRDAIGIDIDERNAELALERVGPMFLTVVDTHQP